MTARFTQSQLRITVSLGVVLAMAAALCAVRVTAQSAGVNVPVLPVVQPGNGLPTLEAALRGDLFLNRQLEPTIAVSTRNPNHVVAFFNDYRAIDIQDFGVGQGNVARNNVFKGLLAKLFVRPARSTRKPPLPARAAAAEAWVGMARSSDGGLTWTGSFVPGSPFDSSPASMASPVKGLEAGSDPVAFAAPCGIVHVVSIFFTRGGQSKMVVTTYQDENTNEGGEAFFYKHQTVVESANNATHGHFVDKPAIAVDVLRGQSSDPCAHNVYISYTTFNGLTSAGKIQSEVIFAKSTDNALTFTRSKLNQPFTENQGTALAVDPRPGIPNTQNGGGGTLYLAWRHFDDPDAIIVTRSTNFGQTFGKPLKITAAPMQTFDQPSIPTTTPNITPAEIAFRSNAFPTVAVAANGNVFVAWQERVDINPNSGTFGLPAAGGSPRIVLMRSTNAGKNWSGPDGTSGQQRAVDLGDRDTVLPEDGLGLLPRLRPSGPQVMPKLAFGGGRLFLSYYESLGLLGPQDTINLADVTPVNIAPPASYIAGIDRVMNVRGALLDPNTGLLLDGTATAQISRYPIRVGANLANGEQLSDIEAVNAPCSPDFGPDLPACVRKVNRVGGPHSGGGTTPFIGDYIDAVPIVTFVPDGNAWKWAIGQNDVPYRAFRSIWADNRNQVPPPGNDPALYPNYSPTSNDCINPGSRNMDVFTSLVNAELVVSAPTTFTKLGAVTHAYPIFVQNMTNANRYFRFTFLLGGGIASFDQFTDADEIRNGIFAFSSFTPVVYVQPSATGTVKVSVEELTCPLDNPVTPEIEGNCTVGGLSGTATINVDPTNTATVAFESHNPLVPNPLVPNPLVPNPLVPNPLVPNPLVPNPLVPNITASNSTLQNATVYDVQYGVTTVTNEGNTTTAFTSDVKIDNPEQYEGKYVFQLVVYKESASGGFQACNTSNIPGFQILASVPMTSAMLNPLVPNPLVPNPLVPNPLVPNPLVPNPLVPNATYNVAPSDHGPTEQNSHDGTTHAPLGPDQVHVALFAYRIVPLPPPGQPDPVPPFNPQVDPPSHNVISTSCNSDGTCPTSFVAPDLVVDGAPSVSPSPLAPGGSVNVSFVLRNSGNYAANAEDGNFVHKLYLSTNTVLDPGDFELGIVATSTGVLGVGATQPFMGTAPTPIPPSTPEGGRYLLLFVDADREVSEINEPNNVVAIPVTVEVPNEAPVASGSSVSTNEDTPKQITLAATDGNGNSVSFQIVTQPTHGSLGVISAVNCTGSNPSSCTASVTYTPGQDYNGADQFTFKARDTRNADSNEATVSITLNPVNDSPVAGADNYGVAEAGSLTVPAPGVLANDTDVDGTVTAVLVSGPANATSFALNADGSFSYVHNGGETTSDSFTYRGTDGVAQTAAVTVSIAVSAVNDAPVANADTASVMVGGSTTINVRTNDTDVDNPASALVVTAVTQGTQGAVSITGGGTTVSYTPSPTFSGSDTFTYTISDGAGGLSTATVTVSVKFGFIGLLTPWTLNPTTVVKGGSSFPVKWQYTDANLAPVNTPNAQVRIRFRQRVSCGSALPETGPEYTNTDTSGNSFFQYFLSLLGQPFVHQFNWQTAGLPANNTCWNIRVDSLLTGQTNGPFLLKLKP